MISHCIPPWAPAVSERVTVDVNTIEAGLFQEAAFFLDFFAHCGVLLREGNVLTSFTDCVLACHASLYRYARSLCGDPWEAEELLQESYKRALAAKRKPAAANADEVRPWVFTIMRNVWLNNQRRMSRWPETAIDDADAVALCESAEGAVGRKLLVSEIRAAVDSLPVLWREVVVMRDMEELSYAQIAAILGCPVGTVMSRLARARGSLRQMLAAQVQEFRK
jgi:RNA polymerase sigma-70 factor, ECF subfamily